ncbi:MAG: sugar phosphate isomerase/epimerase [Chloroflexi bacterium]|nr:sugar phosphate isomerase/epimerase [Chloroflexota bacterium]
MRLAGWTYGYDGIPLEESIPHMTRVGYSGFELATGPTHSTPIDTLDAQRVDEVRRIAETHRLPVVAVSALFGFVPGSEADWAPRWANWRRAIDAAAALGAPVVAACSGGPPEGQTRVTYWPAMVRAVREVCAYAADRGIVVAVEPHWAHAIERPGDLLELIDVVGGSTLSVNCDVCHPFSLGYDLASIAATLGKRAAYAHVCDVRGRHPGGPGPAQHQLVNPGEGEIDWERWLRLLHEAGFRGWIATQISAMRRVWPGYDARREMESIYRVLTEAMARAGVPRL